MYFSLFGNVSRPNLRPIFFRLQLKHLRDKVLLVNISMENDISRARALRAIDFTLNFYHEICEIQRLFWWTKTFETNTETFFWDQIFRDQYWDFFETKIFETDIDTFILDQIFSRLILRLFSIPIPILSKKWEKSR